MTEPSPALLVAPVASDATPTVRTAPAPNAQREHLPFLDGVRGVAIVMVFLFHSLIASFGTGELPWNGQFRSFDVEGRFLLFLPLMYGGYGVSVFFVVSGFCIHLSHQRSSRKDWEPFFLRRAARIYPPYLLALAAFFLMWSLNTPSASLIEKWGNLILHVFTIHNIHPRSLFSINGSFWSIAVEVQLYVLYPVLLWLLTRQGWRRGLWIVAGVEFGLRLLASIYATVRGVDVPTVFYGITFAYWWSWSFGVDLAEAHLKGQRSRYASWRLWFWIPLAILSPLCRVTLPFSFLCWSVATAIVLDRLLAGRWRMPDTGASGWFWRAVSRVGIVSYSLYLLHQPLLGQVADGARGFAPAIFQSPVAVLAACSAAFPAIWLLSELYFRLVEMPSIGWGKQLLAWRSRSRN